MPSINITNVLLVSGFASFCVCGAGAQPVTNSTSPDIVTFAAASSASSAQTGIGVLPTGLVEDSGLNKHSHWASSPSDSTSLSSTDLMEVLLPSQHVDIFFPSPSQSSQVRRRDDVDGDSNWDGDDPDWDGSEEPEPEPTTSPDDDGPFDPSKDRAPHNMPPPPESVTDTYDYDHYSYSPPPESESDTMERRAPKYTPSPQSHTPPPSMPTSPPHSRNSPAQVPAAPVIPTASVGAGLRGRDAFALESRARYSEVQRPSGECLAIVIIIFIAAICAIIAASPFIYYFYWRKIDAADMEEAIAPEEEEGLVKSLSMRYPVFDEPKYTSPMSKY
ncbi:hypothetical protein BV25DRAFT_1832449 [Artomyces pyxidatus]|uniref:Uncharacterized protein n=1 Tax=Artomyces pyxidatus TaxID=48021 RepID=A0ACB8SIZ8_9AGAM|nr:hypothetical protein BV25DRAFT_1832449 [Artomyces pyxidatus]